MSNSGGKSDIPTRPEDMRLPTALSVIAVIQKKVHQPFDVNFSAIFLMDFLPGIEKT